MRFMKSILFVVITGVAVGFGQTDTGHYYLMSYFKDVYVPLNDMSGGFFATSTDGINWVELNDGKPVLTPFGFGEKRMRDPNIFWDARTQTFYYVYTTGWNTKDIGYASIKPVNGKRFSDPASWSAQVSLRFGDDIPNSLCCWAPEIFWDDLQQKFMIFWSTETGADGKRSYCVLTSDFTTFTKPVKFFDPGFTEIDACMYKQAEGNYYMFFKDERQGYKRIYYVTGATPQGPWSDVPVNSITNATLQGVEGPSAIKIGNEYRVYFDPYNTRQNYRMVKSTDLVTWADGGTIKSNGLNFYFSHCNVIEIPRYIYEWITTGNLSVRPNATMLKPIYPSANRCNVPGIYNTLGQRVSPMHSWSNGKAIHTLPTGFFIVVDKDNTGRLLRTER